jgi:hypothetical protein
MQRRQFLGSAVAVGSVAAAGCVGHADAISETQPEPEAQSESDAEGAPDAPSIPMEEFDSGWTIDSERSGFFTDSVKGITTRGTTVAYVDEGLAERVRKQTLDAEVRDLRFFFASRIDYEPAVDDLPFGFGRRLVLDATAAKARDRFESGLAESGLEDIEHRETGSVRTADGSRADLFAYDATYPFEGFEFDAGDSVISVEGQPVASEGLLAVWYSKPVESTVVAGAVNPAENYEQTVERELTEAVALTLDIDLGLEPDAYREESLNLIRSVN